MLSLIASLTCGLIIAADYMLDSKKKISPFLVAGRFVGVGTKQKDSLASISGYERPVFSMCPVGHGVWKLGFHWGIEVKGDPEEFIRSAPEIYIAGPPDLYDAKAEPSSEYSLENGSITPLDRDVTTVEVLGGNEYYTMLSARPALALQQPDGNFIAGYVLTFLTKNVSVNSYGLGVKGFSISYSTGVMTGAGFVDGLGGAHLPQSRE